MSQKGLLDRTDIQELSTVELRTRMPERMGGRANSSSKSSSTSPTEDF
ncbi:hypothetical protein [Verrucomicrobium spinosum]